MSNQTTDADRELLGTNNAKVIKFPVTSPGTIAKGKVISKEVRQARDIDGTPKTFDDGTAKKDVVITIQTDLRDPEIEDDDGTRRIIAGYEIQKAIGQAMRDAGVQTLAEGGLLAVQHTHNEPATKNGRSDTKKFRAQFQPPAPGEAANDLLNSASETTAPQGEQTTASQAQPANSLL